MNFAEGFCKFRPKRFVYVQLFPIKQKQLKAGNSFKFGFSQTVKDKTSKVIEGGTNLPNDGIVYPQPDKT